VGKKRYTKEERKNLLEGFNCKCAYCGCDLNLRTMQLDYIIPLERNGKEELSNIFPVCKECNAYKGLQTYNDFKSSIARIPLTLGKKTASFRMLQRLGFAPKGIWDFLFNFEKMIKNGAKFEQMKTIDSINCINCKYSKSFDKFGLVFAQCNHPNNTIRDKNSAEFLFNCCDEFVLKS
jgi:hypothetical protein